MAWDLELEAFKTRIDLREYASALGYTVDKAESSSTATVMRRGGDKISISRLPDGHYVYDSFRGDLTDRGSIIDFVQKRKGLNLGEVRKELRSWCAGVPSKHLFPSLGPIPKDRWRVVREISQMRVVTEHPYLERRRGIPRKILEHDRFLRCVYMDRRGNAIFPHYDCFPDLQDGVDYYEPCGYEIKNVGFTGFAPGGIKGLWTSWLNPICDNEEIIVCESAIDALSYAVLFPAPNLYVSIAGHLSSAQADLITFLVERVEPVGAMTVVAAMDSDEAGAQLIDAVLIAAERSVRKGLSCRQHVPQGYKDWNEQLLVESRVS